MRRFRRRLGHILPPRRCKGFAAVFRLRFAHGILVCRILRSAALPLRCAALVSAAGVRLHCDVPVSAAGVRLLHRPLTLRRRRKCFALRQRRTSSVLSVLRVRTAAVWT